MEIVKKLESSGSTLSLHVKVIFSASESELVKQLGLNGYRIQTRDGPFIGKDAVSFNMLSAFRSQFGKVRNRWSAAVIRTTGFTLIDIILWVLSGLGRLILWFLKLIFGRRVRLARMTKGITIKSSRIERIKEAEFFIFISLAAVAKAIEYGRKVGQQDIYAGTEFLREIEGLDFAGAGSQVEGEFDEAQNLLAQIEKA